MSPWDWCAIICLAALVALAVGFGLARLLDRFRLDNAQARVTELIEHANKEADNLLKEAELKAKDDLYKKREEADREAEQKRNELQEQQRRVEQSRGEV